MKKLESKGQLVRKNITLYENDIEKLNKLKTKNKLDTSELIRQLINNQYEYEFEIDIKKVITQIRNYEKQYRNILKECKNSKNEYLERKIYDVKTLTEKLKIFIENNKIEEVVEILEETYFKIEFIIDDVKHQLEISKEEKHYEN
jgi:hypothetical protein